MLDTAGILLVDDDAEDRFIIADALEAIYSPRPLYFEKGGMEALQRLTEMYHSGGLPCLLVIDFNMPRIGGAETLGRLKEDERFKHIPVNIYSTSINTAEKETCMKLGAYAYVTKPLSYKESLAVAGMFIEICNTRSGGQE